MASIPIAQNSAQLKAEADRLGIKYNHDTTAPELEHKIEAKRNAIAEVAHIKQQRHEPAEMSKRIAQASMKHGQGLGFHRQQQANGTTLSQAGHTFKYMTIKSKRGIGNAFDWRNVNKD